MQMLKLTFRRKRGKKPDQDFLPKWDVWNSYMWTYSIAFYTLVCAAVLTKCRNDLGKNKVKLE